MSEWFRTFITDKSFFEAAMRTVLMGIAGGVQTGAIPVGAKYWWIPAAAAVLVSTPTKPK